MKESTNLKEIIDKKNQEILRLELTFHSRVKYAIETQQKTQQSIVKGLESHAEKLKEFNKTLLERIRNKDDENLEINERLKLSELEKKRLLGELEKKQKEIDEYKSLEGEKNKLEDKLKSTESELASVKNELEEIKQYKQLFSFTQVFSVDPNNKYYLRSPSQSVQRPEQSVNRPEQRVQRPKSPQNNPNLEQSGKITGFTQDKNIREGLNTEEPKQRQSYSVINTILDDNGLFIETEDNEYIYNYFDKIKENLNEILSKDAQIRKQIIYEKSRELQEYLTTNVLKKEDYDDWFNHFFLLLYIYLYQFKKNYDEFIEYIKHNSKEIIQKIIDEYKNYINDNEKKINDYILYILYDLQTKKKEKNDAELVRQELERQRIKQEEARIKQEEAEKEAAKIVGDFSREGNSELYVEDV